MKLPQLSVVRETGSAGHHIDRAVGLGKRNDLPDRGSPSQEGDDPVHAQGDPSMGRSTHAEGLKKEAEPLLRLGRADSQSPKDPFLGLAPVNPDASSADLLAIQNEVIGQGAHATRVILQAAQVLRVGRGERVVAGDEAPLFVPLEEREVVDPEKVGPGGVDELEGLPEM